MAAGAQGSGDALGGRRRLAVWGGAAVLMVLPVLAMRVTSEMAWDLGDFIFLGILLALVCGSYELAARVSDRRAYHVGFGLALIATFFQLWINLAVGIIGSENNPANLLFSAVLAIAVLGALLARLRPLGMARAMIVTAVAQATVFVIALVGGLGFTGPITVFFVALWLTAAWLFSKAAREA